jgi:biopolymer transport protein TolQ
MNYDASFIGYFIQAGLIVKCVMLLLVGASIVSWTYILQRMFYLKEVNRSTTRFEQAFWSGEDMARLYSDGNRNRDSRDGVEAIFHAGFKEFTRFRKQERAPVALVVENTQRAMQVAQMREQDKMEKHLQFLAIVGSTSPYVGLFGTVWGIMQAFRALANVQQATISMVAPGIAEALIATALGLFAAIPAVIAYNRFAGGITRLMTRFDAFKEEFTNILIRQTQQTTSTRLEEVVE